MITEPPGGPSLPPLRLPDHVPELVTARLTLRQPGPADADLISLYAGAREVAAMTANIPHPYPPGAALDFINGAWASAAARDAYLFAVIADVGLVGMCGLHGVSRETRRAEIGYWVGLPHWSRGYASEAAAEVTRWALEDTGLHRVYGMCLTENVASARVLEKAGMTYEGTLKHHSLKWGVFSDLRVYGRVGTGGS
ncbi:MAG: GNAT family N-acetyltransferase [Candidatus Dormibacteria bacterium]